MLQDKIQFPFEGFLSLVLSNTPDGRLAFEVFDVVSVGHLCIDSIFLPDKHPCTILGGSVTYVSLIARRLNAATSIISKVGRDFPEAYLWWLKQEDINLSGVTKVEDARTTRFELKYDNNLSNRILRLISKAPLLTVNDLPSSLQAKAIHIAPIAGEVTFEVAEKLKSCAEFLSLDPQGLVRKFDENGNLTQNQLTDKRILELVNIYKSSLNEIKAVTNQSDLNLAIKAIHDYGIETVIVTLGMKGAVLSIEETMYDISPYHSEKVVDPTGAGDVFIGGFLAEYIRGEDSLWCACVGSAAASLVIEAVGPTFLGEKTEIYRRAHVLYEKEIKQ